MDGPWNLSFSPLTSGPWDERWSDDAKQIWVDEAIGKITSQIVSITTRIHRLWLTGPHDYDSLAGRLQVPIQGPLKRILKRMKGKWTRRRKPTYNKGYQTVVDNILLDIFTDPKKQNSNVPKCIIEMSYPTPEFLLKLNEMLPDMQVSSIEYAIDYHFHNPLITIDFFNMLLRYLYIVRMRLTRKGKLDRSKVFPNVKLIKKKRNGGYEYVLYPFIKVYGRGPDSKLRKYWIPADLQTVRLEITYKNRNMPSFIMKSLPQFLGFGCHFEDVVKKMVKFRKFYGASGVPREWDRLQATLGGHKYEGLFMPVFFALGPKRYRKIATVELLDRLLLPKLLHQAHAYDLVWEEFKNKLPEHFYGIPGETY